MKTKHLFLFIIASFVMFVSCSKDEETVLQLTSASVRNAPKEVFQHLITFDCNVPWTATVDVPWCTISQNQGNGNSPGQILVTGEANLTIEGRTANIIIQAGLLSKKVTLVQAAIIPALLISPAFIPVNGEQEYSITITSNWQWTATVNDAANNWCTVTPNSGFGDKTITVSVAKNYAYARRFAFISIISENVQKTDTILQIDGEAYSDPSIAVAINGVTWATRNVGNFGTFTDFSTDPGKYYQFNRTTGYSYIAGNIEPAFDSEYNAAYSDWILLNDPCPCGWRLPTETELSDLYKSGFFWVDEPAGAWLGPDAASATFVAPGNAIFLPAKGLISNSAMVSPEEGYYWTSTQRTSATTNFGYMLTFGQSSQLWGGGTDKTSALLIRCVKE